MSRPWRIEYEGALYHLLSHGNERSDIFINDKDGNSFFDAVGEMSERLDIDIFDYVLMANHCQLLTRTRQANLKKGDPVVRHHFHPAVQSAAFSI